VLTAVTEGALCLAAHLAARPRGRRPATWPHVTVILPYRERQPIFTAAVRSLVASGYPRERLRIVLVDDRSPVDHREALAGLGRDFPDVDLVATRVEEAPGPGQNGKVRALAWGLGLARREPADVLVFADADCEYPPGYIAEMVAAIAATPGALVSTGYALAGGAGPVTGFVWQALIGRCLWGGASALRVIPGAFGGAMAVRVDALDAAGGLRGLETLVAEDIGLACRFAAAGRWPRHVALPQPVVQRARIEPMAVRRWVFGALDVYGRAPRFALPAAALVGALLVSPVILAVWAARSVLIGGAGMAPIVALGGVVAVETGIVVWLGRDGPGACLRLLPCFWVARVAILRALVAGRHGMRWKGRRVDAVRPGAA